MPELNLRYSFTDCFLFPSLAKEAKIAKEKELGIYKEKKVRTVSVKNREIREVRGWQVVIRLLKTNRPSCLLG